MLNQKLQSAELMEWVFEDETYDTDPCELKLDEMIEAEPEPEMIEGMPASDALTRRRERIRCGHPPNHPRLRFRLDHFIPF